VLVFPELAALVCTADYEDTRERFGDPVRNIPLPAGDAPLVMLNDGEEERQEEEIRAFRHKFLVEPSAPDERLHKAEIHLLAVERTHLQSAQA
jgi:hypothetical protein